MSVMFPISMAPGPHSGIFLHSTILRPKKPLGSWNLVNPLLSMNKAWVDECAARLQPLIDQYKPIQQQTFAIEKFRDLIVKTRSCPGDKKFLFKKILIRDPRFSIGDLRFLLETHRLLYKNIYGGLQ